MTIEKISLVKSPAPAAALFNNKGCQTIRSDSGAIFWHEISSLSDIGASYSIWDSTLERMKKNACMICLSHEQRWQHLGGF